MKRLAAFIAFSVAGILCGWEAGKHEWWIVIGSVVAMRIFWTYLDTPDVTE